MKSTQFFELSEFSFLFLFFSSIKNENNKQAIRFLKQLFILLNKYLKNFFDYFIYSRLSVSSHYLNFFELLFICSSVIGNYSLSQLTLENETLSTAKKEKKVFKPTIS